MNLQLQTHFKNAKNYYCMECGKQCDCGNEYRWNGQTWEHHHGYPIGHVVCEKKTKERYKLSEELVDGVHWTVVDSPDEVVSAVKEWAENEKISKTGDGFFVEIVNMTDEEIDALPDI